MRLCQWQQNSCFPQLQFDHQTLFKVSCSKHTLTRKVSWDKGEQRFSLLGHNDVFDWRNESWSSSRCYANYLASKLWQPHQKEVVGVFCFCCFFRNRWIISCQNWFIGVAAFHYVTTATMKSEVEIKSVKHGALQLLQLPSKIQMRPPCFVSRANFGKSIVSERLSVSPEGR